MVNLNKCDIEFILTKMVTPTYIQDKLKRAQDGIIGMTDDDLDILIDLCGQHFQLFGINKNDNPNEYGLKLEDLLDKLQ